MESGPWSFGTVPYGPVRCPGTKGSGQAPCWVDIVAFKELEARDDAASLAAAVELYQGEFLEGLYLAGCTDFEIWLVGERERWRQRVARALETLVTHHSRRGEYQQSLRFAHRLLALEPWREEAHRQMMRLLAHSGRRGAALAQYETCRRVLAEELGVEPTEETKALCERIQAATSRRHNLPPQPTPFVGREEELAEVVGLLDNPDCRLLTIFGPGGIGKTRLALQAAMTRTEAFLEGVYFVPLVGVSAAEFIASAIADALQFSFFGSQDPQVQLLNYLRGKEVLLILDSFEHLLEGAGLLEEILQKAVEVKLLVTSRERLNLRWERCFEVEGLRYPEGDVTGDRELEGCSAVQLLLQTAQRRSRRFSLSARNESAVVRICQLVEGMPLGIELAAGWVGTHTCVEIAGEIEGNLGFLALSRRDTPERHRSMRATFEHSWRLLTPSERDALMRLSVFCGGFSRKAAGEVAGASRIVLGSLVDKSLLRFLPSGRYEMHELLRQYAAEKLVALPEAQIKACDRHCAHYTAFLQHWEADLTGAGAAEALTAIRAEMANVRAAWRWAVTQAKTEEIERGLDGVSRFCLLAGLYQEGETLTKMTVDRLRALVEKADKPERDLQIDLSKSLAEQARFLNRQGMYDRAIAVAREAVNLAQTERAVSVEAVAHLHWGQALCRQGAFGAAQTRLEQALTLARAVSLRQVEADGLLSLGNVSHGRGAYAEARAYFEQALPIYREIGDWRGEGASLNNLGTVCHHVGDDAGATAYYEQALSIYRQTGDRQIGGAALHNLARVFLQQGNYAEARAYLEQGLRVWREIGDRQSEGWSLLNLGRVALQQGEYAKTKAYCEQALRIFREISARQGEGLALINLGCVSRQRGDYAEAAVHLEQALLICREIGDRQGEGWTLTYLSDVSTEQGDYAEARAYLEQALRIYREIGDREGEGWGLGSLSLLFHHLGDDEAAQECSQQALAIVQELGNRSLQGDALTHLGHALAGLGHLDEAAEAYRQALDIRRELGERNRAMESLAGLARVSLAQSDLTQAQAQVEEILAHLETGSPSTGTGHALDGTDEPFRVYLTCYRVLRAGQDPRAREILGAAYSLLQERAAKITDEELRHSFFENVASHREIAEAWKAP